MVNKKRSVAACCRSAGRLVKAIPWFVPLALLGVGFCFDAVVYVYARTMPGSYALMGAFATATVLFNFAKFYTSPGAVKMVLGSQIAMLLCLLSPYLVLSPWLQQTMVLFLAWSLLHMCLLRMDYLVNALRACRSVRLGFMLQPLLLAAMPFLSSQTLLHCALVVGCLCVNVLVLLPQARRTAGQGFDIGAAWSVALVSSLSYSLGMILCDIWCARGSSWYYLSDCWKTLAVALYNKKIHAGLSVPAELEDVSVRINRWLDGMFPWMMAYVCVSSLVCGYGLAMGGWVACRLIALSAIMACPCVLSCVGPFIAMASQRKPARCAKLQKEVVANQVSSSLLLVKSYYAVSLCLSSGMSLYFFGQLMQPWHGALLMVSAQALLYCHIMYQPVLRVVHTMQTVLRSTHIDDVNRKRSNFFSVSKNSPCRQAKNIISCSQVIK